MEKIAISDQPSAHRGTQVLLAWNWGRMETNTNAGGILTLDSLSLEGRGVP
jgi:hypothetical protein